MFDAVSSRRPWGYSLRSNTRKIICMSEVTDHYEHLLAHHYTWMFGTSFADKVAEQKSFLTQALQSLKPSPTPQLAVDLGSGPGFQTIALAQLGFSSVLAIATSP